MRVAASPAQNSLVVSSVESAHQTALAMARSGRLCRGATGPG